MSRCTSLVCLAFQPNSISILTSIPLLFVFTPIYIYIICLGGEVLNKLFFVLLVFFVFFYFFFAFISVSSSLLTPLALQAVTEQSEDEFCVLQPPTNTQNHRGPHRALQMCAFQIGLYALGLNNCVSPNWLSRTYSSHVSWISSEYSHTNIPTRTSTSPTPNRQFSYQSAAKEPKFPL